MRKISLVTSNPGKFQEIAARLRTSGIAVEQLDIPHPEIQADTLDEVVLFKIGYIQKTEPKKTIIVDDSGLFIDSLGGFPGVYSSYALRTIGCEGLLRLLKGSAKRDAQFECCIAYSAPGLGEPTTFKGICAGKIALKAAGRQGFGFDPIFEPRGLSKSFAMMDMKSKNRISHRGKAMEMLARYLEKEH